MELKTIKMEWDICSSPPCITFYPYTMFQNPMHKASSQKSRKTIVTHKVLVTESSNIVLCDWHTQKAVCAYFQAFSNNFSLLKLMWFFFSFFIRGSEVNSQNFHILLILTGKYALKWVEWCVFRDSGMPNPVMQVSSLYDKWLLKNHNFRQKFHILLILAGKNASNCLEWCTLRFQGMLNPMELV